MSKELFKLLLDKEFYTSNRSRITFKLFPEEIQTLVKFVINMQEVDLRDYTITEVWELFKAKNPVMTDAMKVKYHEILSGINKLPVLTQSVAVEVLREAWKHHTLNEVVNEALLISENKSDSWDKLEKLIEVAKEGYIVEKKDNYLEMDLESLLQKQNLTFKWKWNYEPLDEQLGGLGGGLLCIIAARTDAGKTLFYVHSTFAPGGWLDQGAKVHILCNEEPASRTLLRGVSSLTGKTVTEIQNAPENYLNLLDKYKDNLFIKDIDYFTVQDLEKYCYDKDIDILIVDQIDKIMGFDSDNTANNLQKLYERVRLLGKKYDFSPILITQASVEAEGKLYYGASNLNNSRTGKAGEADFILCIGMKSIDKDNQTDDGYRVINIAKNKSGGGKNPVPCYFNKNISRVEYVRQNISDHS